MLFLGLDPGKSGGISWHYSGAPFNPDYKKMAFAEGFTNKTPMDIYRLIKKRGTVGQCIAMIEKVHSMPKQGVASSFTFGQGYGFLLGCLTALEIPFEYVTPHKWQGYLHCRSGGDKNITKQKAQELFPTLKITHAIADALLIGEYLQRTHYKNLDLDLEL